MPKRLTDTERAQRYARQSYRADLRYIAEVAYRAGIRIGRKLEREKK